MKGSKKYIALALMLAFITAAAGCGNEKKQEAAPEAGETGAPETIGSGAGEGTKAGTEDTKDDGTDEGTEEPKDETGSAVSKEVYVEEQEIYNDNGIIITVTGIEAGERGGAVLHFDFTNNGNVGTQLEYEELYVGDTLVAGSTLESRTIEVAVDSQFTEPGETGQLMVAIMDDGVREAIREELPEISFVFHYRVDEGSPVALTPKLTFPVLRK